MSRVYPLAGLPVFLDGRYKPNPVDSSWAYPVQFPSIVKGEGRQWEYTTNINTPGSALRGAYEGFLKAPQSWYDITWEGLTQPESYELSGLLYAIADFAEAYSAARFGNHGTESGMSLKDDELADRLHTHTLKAAARANELLDKIAR